MPMDQSKELGPEAMEIFNLLDLGDFIGVEGAGFVTKTGEKYQEALERLTGHKLA